MDHDHQPQVTFLGPTDEWCKAVGKYTHLYNMDTENAYNWLRVWFDAKNPSFAGFVINTLDTVC